MANIRMTAFGPRKIVHVTLPPAPTGRYVLVHPTEGEIELPAGTHSVELPANAGLQIVMTDAESAAATTQPQRKQP